MNRKSKKYSQKNRWDFVGIFTCGFKCVCGGGVIVAYEFKGIYKRGALYKPLWIRRCIFIFRYIILFLYV